MQRLLLIGATSSVASNLARLYAQEPTSMYLLGRNQARLSALREELGSCVVGTETLDFNTFENNAPAIQRAIESLGGIDLAIIAHGYLGDQEASEGDFNEAVRITSTNYLSVVSLLIPLSQHMESAQAGHIVAISSVAGVRGRPRNYTYGAAKSALRIYLQGLRSRLYPKIVVTTILLGPVDTPMTVAHEKTRLFTSSPKAAKGIRQAIQKQKGEAYVPRYFRPLLSIVVALPESLFQKISSLSAR